MKNKIKNNKKLMKFFKCTLKQSFVVTRNFLMPQHKFFCSHNKIIAGTTNIFTVQGYNIKLCSTFWFIEFKMFHLFLYCKSKFKWLEQNY